ncbi:MAG TPA: sulfate adenylyltransferase subunit CysD [Vicinamibacterales bacterium]|nr:sulfate adenylyltransferase subunit CysD [Vicinamibacterales bacterium]
MDPICTEPSESRCVLPRRTRLDELESEAIYVLRETAAQFERPALLFSGGKDSITLVHLARKAFWPGRMPFPLLHVDTGHNFPETLVYRDWLVKRLGCDLLVCSVQQSIDSGRAIEEAGPAASRNALQTITLLDGLVQHRIDAALGGARRDEEKARAKERVFSHRDVHGQWDPRAQRPELWAIYNGRKRPGEHFRVFPLSNWTELDVWSYIAREGLALPALYFAHPRRVYWRDGLLLADTPYAAPRPGEDAATRMVRFRTVGDATCTGAIESTAATVEAIIDEIGTLRLSERGARADDQRSEAAMEDRKRQGYF